MEWIEVHSDLIQLLSNEDAFKKLQFVILLARCDLVGGKVVRSQGSIFG